MATWLGCALLVVFMQSAGLVHRVQHGEPLYGLPTQDSDSKVGQTTAPGVLTAVAETADTDAPPGNLPRLHPNHSCVLFDGHTVFAGGAFMPPALPSAHACALVVLAGPSLPVDLPLLPVFRSRAPPYSFMST